MMGKSFVNMGDIIVSSKFPARASLLDHGFRIELCQGYIDIVVVAEFVMPKVAESSFAKQLYHESALCVDIEAPASKGVDNDLLDIDGDGLVTTAERSVMMWTLALH